MTAKGTDAVATNGACTESLNLSLTGLLPTGAWIHSLPGAARGVITEDEVRLISDALAGPKRVMAGEPLGDAFADIEAGGRSFRSTWPQDELMREEEWNRTSGY